MPNDHRLTDVWGEDANVWNPLRFVGDSSEKEVKIGMYSNLCVLSPFQRVLLVY